MQAGRRPHADGAACEVDLTRFDTVCVQAVPTAASALKTGMEFASSIRKIMRCANIMLASKATTKAGLQG